MLFTGIKGWDHQWSWYENEDESANLPGLQQFIWNALYFLERQRRHHVSSLLDGSSQAENVSRPQDTRNWTAGSIKVMPLIHLSQAQGEELAKEFDPTDFQMSRGWVDRLKARHKSNQRPQHRQKQQWSGEERSCDRCWKNTTKRTFSIQTKLVYFINVYSTRLWRLKETCPLGKRFWKERISTLVAANMNGSQKLPLLVIGKFKMPRCMCNIQILPVTNKASQQESLNEGLNLWGSALKVGQEILTWRQKYSANSGHWSAHPEIESNETDLPPIQHCKFSAALWTRHNTKSKVPLQEKSPPRIHQTSWWKWVRRQSLQAHCSQCHQLCRCCLGWAETNNHCKLFQEGSFLQARWSRHWQWQQQHRGPRSGESVWPSCLGSRHC